MKVVVVGGGKVGYYLAKTLIEHSHYPTLIEINKGLCSYLANDLDIPVIFGDGTTLETLTDAGIEEADALVSVTGKDEDNLISCQLAKSVYHVPKTVSRVNNPKNVEVMKQLGIDIIVNTTDNIARSLEREIDLTKIKQIMTLHRGEVSIDEISLPEDHYPLAGKTLAQLHLPESFVLISIFRGDQLIIPRGNTQVMGGDKIMVLSPTNKLHALKAALKL
ncbi:MAG: TrkA family potassium uptake protein [Oscillospiraceae bacterium]|nr:TrkA family potassium uptake protein [Oscillospiraceae bacterium]